MSLQHRLAALERAPGAAVSRCDDPFHRPARIDYREAMIPLCPPGTVLPPAPRCPACDGPRYPDLIRALPATEEWRP